MGKEIQETEKRPLMQRMADTWGVDPQKLTASLKQVCFRQRGDQEVSDAQLMALMIIAEQYSLNPFVGELKAFLDPWGGIVPVVTVDGWLTKINSDPRVKQITIEFAEEMVKIDAHAKEAPTWVEVTIHRNDREYALPVREYLDELYIPPRPKKWQGKPTGELSIGPWQTHTKRMLRHKGIIQAARVVLGFSGIYDPDEAGRIIEGEAIVARDQQPAKGMQGFKEKVAKVVPEEPVTAGERDDLEALPGEEDLADEA